MTAPVSGVFTIPACVPFVDAVAAQLLVETAGHPLDLARYLVLLPTRRACRALREAFLRRAAGQALLLPRMVPLGDLDAEDIDLSEGAIADPLDLPPALTGLSRQLLLARLIRSADGLHWDLAIALARELGLLLDQIETEGSDFSRLATLVPEEHAEHWQKTLAVLRVLGDAWPAVVAERGMIDAAERRNRVIRGQAARWQLHPPTDPVIAAGSTGSIPATAELLAIIAALPNGRVILPGLDTDLPDQSWSSLDPCHPQYGLKALLDRLKLERSAVRPFPCGGIGDTAPGRAALLSVALDPVPGPIRRAALDQSGRTGWAGVARIDCPTAQREAEIIAIALREVLETPGRTGALVTPDRALGRRVAAELARFGVTVDDSGGLPLGATPSGAFLRLLIDAARSGPAPAPLLALLKHPLAAGGMDRAAFRVEARLLERLVLRGPRPGGGFSGLAAALANRVADPDISTRIARYLDHIGGLLTPLCVALAEAEIQLDAVLRVHGAVAEAFAATDQATGADSLWAGEGGAAAASFLDEAIRAAELIPPIAGSDYPGLFDQLAIGRVVRPSYGTHPRLAILGPLEARLQHFDRVILGGLNEGVWPTDPPADPWLSRPMRDRFGLPSPERRIGQSAHDFAQAFGAPDVVLTRAERVDGTPTVPSRWLRYLDILARALDLPRAAPPWLAWADHLDRPERATGTPNPMPAPCPPLVARPQKLSVTQIEQWMRDPYGLYARHILKLRPLDPLDADADAAERGKVVHTALDAFVKAYPDHVPPDAFDRLIEIGRQSFGPVLGQPGVWAFWWPRFEAIARWFIDEERHRRRDIAVVATELSGEITLPTASGDFVLAAKADRIEKRRDGTFAIIDYKTGGVPKKADVEAGFSPQLPLEALIARGGGFRSLGAGKIGAIEVWKLSGGAVAGEIIAPVADIDIAVDHAEAGLITLIDTFSNPTTAYQPVPRSGARPRYNDYEHLARIREWAAHEDGE